MIVLLFIIPYLPVQFAHLIATQFSFELFPMLNSIGQNRELMHDSLTRNKFIFGISDVRLRICYSPSLNGLNIHVDAINTLTYSAFSHIMTTFQLNSWLFLNIPQLNGAWLRILCVHWKYNMPLSR